jgi:magnesium transporter
MVVQPAQHGAARAEDAMARRIVKRFNPPGTLPGTMTAREPGVPGARMALVHYAERQEVALAQLAALIPEGATGWLRMVGHDPASLAVLGEQLKVHPLVLEDVVHVGQRSKIEDYGSYLFIVVNLIRLKEGEVEEEQISLLVFDRLLVSVQERESDLFQPILDRLQTQRGKARTQGVDYLAYALVDTMVDHYFPLLENLAERLEDIEEELLKEPRRETLQELHGVKRVLLRLRKTTWPLREMVGALGRGESALMREGTRVWLRDVYDHCVQIIDIVETFREMSTSLADLYQSGVANRMNEIMKVLTIIATIFIPLTFIVGVYGMNFRPEAGPLAMPELSWRWGYPAVWLVMLGMAGWMLVLFKRRRWL